MLSSLEWIRPFVLAHCALILGCSLRRAWSCHIATQPALTSTAQQQRGNKGTGLLMGLAGRPADQVGESRATNSVRSPLRCELVFIFLSRFSRLHVCHRAGASVTILTDKNMGTRKSRRNDAMSFPGKRTLLFEALDLVWKTKGLWPEMKRCGRNRSEITSRYAPSASICVHLRLIRSKRGTLFLFTTEQLTRLRRLKAFNNLRRRYTAETGQPQRELGCERTMLSTEMESSAVVPPLRCAGQTTLHRRAAHTPAAVESIQ